MLKVRATLATAFLAACVAAYSQVDVLDGVTFADEPGVTYVAIKEIGFRVGWAMTSDKRTFYVNEQPVPVPRTLFDGTRLVKLRELCSLGVVIGEKIANEVPIQVEGREILIRLGEKRVMINKADQRLRAYQGDRLVMETRVSTGRRGFTTPSGTWTAGPEKSRMRYSRKYDNSPMPWSIQIHGGYFMHGYPSVPKRPASHGCIRLLLRHGNPAKWLWHWIDLGTPITIANDWGDASVATTPKSAPADSPRETIPIGN